MNTKNKHSIRYRLLFSLIIFFIIILAVVWVSEVLLFNRSYEKYQIKTMDSAANKIKNSDSKKLISTIDALAYENQICAVITSSSRIEYEVNTRINGCILNHDNQEISKIANSFIQSNEDISSYRVSLKDNKVLGYLYGIKYSGGYVFLYSSLQDTSSVTSILKNQMIYTTVIAIATAIIISYILSKGLTKPIVDITNKAKYLGTDENVRFEKKGIEEIDALAEALNLAQSEIGKTEQLQKDLLANVSHDLKTPLTMIKAYAEMIRDISYKDTEKMKEHLNVIKEESDRLTLLVNDILDLSELQANAVKLRKEKYDLIEEINSIIHRYDIIKETEDYKFIIDAPDKLIVNADKNKINQVIYNLINNAINYTGNDKTIYITISKDKKVKITDTGKGIKKEDLDVIWNRYYKTEKKHKRNVVSTGLGLSIVKEILVKHDFQYGVTTSNKGTTFYFKMK